MNDLNKNYNNDGSDEKDDNDTILDLVQNENDDDNDTASRVMQKKQGTLALIVLGLIVTFLTHSNIISPPNIDTIIKLESTPTSLTDNTSTIYVSVSPNINITVHIAIVACGRACLNAQMLIKSIILFGEAKIYKHSKCILHIFIDSSTCSADITIDIIDTGILPNWLLIDFINLNNIEFNAYDLSEFGEFCGGVRILLPYILPYSIKLILYLDADTIFMKPIDEIITIQLNDSYYNWNNKNQYKLLTKTDSGISSVTDNYHISSTLMLIGREREIQYDRYHDQLNRLLSGYYVEDMKRSVYYSPNTYYGETGINSGVFFYNLYLARNMKPNFTQILYNIIQYLPNQGTKMRDQELLNYYFIKNSKYIRILTCDWNNTPDKKCLISKYNQIIHGNRNIFNDIKNKYHIIYEILKTFNDSDIIKNNDIKNKIINITYKFSEDITEHTRHHLFPQTGKNYNKNKFVEFITINDNELED